jgi:transposase InsO family protein
VLLVYLFYGISYPVVTLFFSFPTYYGSEFTANTVRRWLKDLGVTALYIEPGSPWENGYVESYIGKLRDELLNGEILDTLMEAKVLVEGWRKEYNLFRPHSSLGYRPPAPEAYEVEKFTQGLVY